MRRTARLCLTFLIPAATVLAAQTPPEPDPFYVTLFHEGVQAYAEGDPVRAVRDLRLACFGLLEDPPRLAACLARLAVAQAAAEDRDGFTETFGRLSVVERRFSGYSRAELPPGVRADLEQRLVRWIPADLLAETSAFRPLADRQRAAALARLPAPQQREELARLIEREPANPSWRLRLAELELQAKDLQAAASQVEAALAADPGSASARCLRGLVRAGEGACAAAVADLAACPRSRAEEPFAEALLACRVSLGQAGEAAAFYEALPPELRQSRKLARLARDAGQGTAAPEEASPAAEGNAGNALAAGGAEGQEPAPGTVDATGGEDPVTTVAELSTAERTQLEKAQSLLRETRYAGDLEEPLRLAREVADAHPALVEAQHLAAQIAYRASKWQLAAEYFRRGGDPGDGQPVLLFYMAVSFYEVGDTAAAATALRRALPRLEKTAFVTRYVEKILGPEEASRWAVAGEALAR